MFIYIKIRITKVKSKYEFPVMAGMKFLRLKPLEHTIVTSNILNLFGI